MENLLPSTDSEAPDGPCGPSLVPLKAKALFKLMLKCSQCRELKDEGVSVGSGGTPDPWGWVQGTPPDPPLPL